MTRVGEAGSIASLGWMGNRSAWISQSIEASQKAAEAGATTSPITAEELGERLDELERNRLRYAEKIVALETKTADVQWADVNNGDGTFTRLTGEAAKIYFYDQLEKGKQRRASIPNSEFSSFTALNVDTVIKHANASEGTNPGKYAEYVKLEVENLKRSSSNFIFAGAMGNDRVTHDVDEYIDWLNMAILKRAAAATKE